MSHQEGGTRARQFVHKVARQKGISLAGPIHRDIEVFTKHSPLDAGKHSSDEMASLRLWDVLITKKKQPVHMIA